MTVRDGSLLTYGAESISRARRHEKDIAEKIALLDAAFPDDFAEAGSGGAFWVPGVGRKIVYYIFDPDYQLEGPDDERE